MVRKQKIALHQGILATNCYFMHCNVHFFTTKQYAKTKVNLLYVMRVVPKFIDMY